MHVGPEEVRSLPGNDQPLSEALIDYLLRKADGRCQGRLWFKVSRERCATELKREEYGEKWRAVRIHTPDPPDAEDWLNVAMCNDCADQWGRLSALARGEAEA